MALAKKIGKIILMIFGVLFILVIFAGIWFYFADPLHIVNPSARPALNTLPNTNTQRAPSAPGQSSGQQPSGPLTTPTLTPEMENCMLQALGAERVKELGAGADPTMADAYKIRGCI